MSWSPDGIYTYLDDDSNRILEVNRSMIGDHGWWGFAQSQTHHCVEKELLPDGGNRCTRSETTPAADFGEKTNIWEDGTSMAPFDMPFYCEQCTVPGMLALFARHSSCRGCSCWHVLSCRCLFVGASDDERRRGFVNGGRRGRLLSR